MADALVTLEAKWDPGTVAADAQKTLADVNRAAGGTAAAVATAAEQEAAELAVVQAQFGQTADAAQVAGDEMKAAADRAAAAAQRLADTPPPAPMPATVPASIDRASEALARAEEKVAAFSAKADGGLKGVDRAASQTQFAISKLEKEIETLRAGGQDVSALSGRLEDLKAKQAEAYQSAALFSKSQKESGEAMRIAKVQAGELHGQMGTLTDLLIGQFPHAREQVLGLFAAFALGEQAARVIRQTVDVLKQFGLDLDVVVRDAASFWIEFADSTEKSQKELGNETNILRSRTIALGNSVEDLGVRYEGLAEHLQHARELSMRQAAAYDSVFEALNRLDYQKVSEGLKQTADALEAFVKEGKPIAELEHQFPGITDQIKLLREEAGRAGYTFAKDFTVPASQLLAVLSDIRLGGGGAAKILGEINAEVSREGPVAQDAVIAMEHLNAAMKVLRTTGPTVESLTAVNHAIKEIEVSGQSDKIKILGLDLQKAINEVHPEKLAQVAPLIDQLNEAAKKAGPAIEGGVAEKLAAVNAQAAALEKSGSKTAVANLVAALNELQTVVGDTQGRIDHTLVEALDRAVAKTRTLAGSTGEASIAIGRHTAEMGQHWALASDTTGRSLLKIDNSLALAQEAVAHFADGSVKSYNLAAAAVDNLSERTRLALGISSPTAIHHSVEELKELEKAIGKGLGSATQEQLALFVTKIKEIEKSINLLPPAQRKAAEADKEWLQSELSLAQGRQKEAEAADKTSEAALKKIEATRKEIEKERDAIAQAAASLASELDKADAAKAGKKSGFDPAELQKLQDEFKQLRDTPLLTADQEKRFEELTGILSDAGQKASDLAVGMSQFGDATDKTSASQAQVAEIIKKSTNELLSEGGAWQNLDETSRTTIQNQLGNLRNLGNAGAASADVVRNTFSAVNDVLAKAGQKAGDFTASLAETGNAGDDAEASLKRLQAAAAKLGDQTEELVKQNEKQKTSLGEVAEAHEKVHKSAAAAWKADVEGAEKVHGKVIDVTQVLLEYEAAHARFAASVLRPS